MFFIRRIILFFIVITFIQLNIAFPCQFDFPPLLSGESHLDIVRRQQKVLTLLYKTTGFRNRSEFKEAIGNLSSSAVSKMVARLMDILINEKVEIGIHLEPGIRDSVIKGGIQNQHQTGNSLGSYNPEVRQAVEASYLGLDYQTYINLKDVLKPKYGLLRPTPELGLDPPNANIASDTYILKLKVSRNRLTWTPGDSTNRVMHNLFDDIVTKKRVFSPQSWDQIFISWRDRLMMLPLLVEGLRRYRWGGTVLNPNHPLLGFRFPRQNIIGSWPKSSPMKKLMAIWDISFGRYIEVQIWGEITLNDIETFEYLGSPPKGKFLEALQSRGINIRQGNWPSKEWIENNDF